MSAAQAKPATLGEWMAELLASCYRDVIPKLNVWRWADSGEVFLDERATSTPGYYSSKKTPYNREFMETFTDTRFDEDHVMKASRVGATEAALNVVRYMPANRPGAALIAIDTTDEAKKIATDRLIPTLPAASLTDDDDDVTKKLIRLKNMIVHVSGSYSPSIFRNKWLMFVFLDEIEVVEEIDSEGTLHDLARSRQHDVPGAKLFTASKPKRWRSKHHCEVVSGTLSAYLVPCPHCGTFQELSFDGTSPTYSLRIEDSLKHGDPAPSPALWPCVPPPRLGRFRFEHCKDESGIWDIAKIESETWYECVSGCRMTNADLKGAVRSGLGRWLQTNPKPVPRRRSRHIWDAYSLHEKLTIGFLAREFVLAQSDPNKLLHFVNNHLGMPWRERQETIGDKQVAQCFSDYKRGEIPFEPSIVLIGVDSQFDHYKFVLAAYKLNRERAVVNWGRAGTGAELLDMFNHGIPVAGSPEKTFKPYGGFIDASGAEGTTARVYSLCQSSFSRESGTFRLFPSFGRDFSTATKVIWTSEILHDFKPLRIYFFADDVFKRRLYHGSIMQAVEIKQACAAGYEPELKNLPPRLHLPQSPKDQARRELMDELQSESVNSKGKWTKDRGRPNDYGDALKLCDVMFDYLRPKLLEAEALRQAEAAKAKTAGAA